MGRREGGDWGIQWESTKIATATSSIAASTAVCAVPVHAAELPCYTSADTVVFMS